MRKLLIVIVAATLLGIVGFIIWETAKSRPGLNGVGSETLYEVKKGEVSVMGPLISRVLVGTNVTVTYRNRTEQSQAPAYTIRFYNRDAVLLGKKEIWSENSPIIAPGEVASQPITFEQYPLKEILQKSSLKVSDGWEKIHWVSISLKNETE